MNNKKQEELWQERLNRYEQSGLSKSEYCRRNNLNIHQLVYWKKRLKQFSGGSFVQISGSSRPVEIHIGSKVKLVVDSGYNAGVIKSLVELLSDVRN
ncbi:MAG: hypothetical protein IT292_01460 [Deltaproteobacteria bacterium]|nr:hypothetical protein [Deltaproteobacteria bacterium]